MSGSSICVDGMLFVTSTAMVEDKRVSRSMFADYVIDLISRWPR